jgi:hypothetical protein
VGLTNKQIIAAFKNTGGIVSKVAMKLNVTRQAIYARMMKSEELRDAQISARETAIDMAEDKLMANISKGDNTAIIFYLKTQGKRRGYIEKQEVEQSGSLSVNSAPKIVFNEPKTDKPK